MSVRIPERISWKNNHTSLPGDASQRKRSGVVMVLSRRREGREAEREDDAGRGAGVSLPHKPASSAARSPRLALEEMLFLPFQSSVLARAPPSLLLSLPGGGIHSRCPHS